MAERIPAWEPGPRPSAITSISCRAMPLSRKSRSTRVRPVDPRGPGSARVPMHRAAEVEISPTATERRSDENSSPRIFISNETLRLVLDAEGNHAQVFRDGNLIACLIEPFDERDSAGGQ